MKPKNLSRTSSSHYPISFVLVFLYAILAGCTVEIFWKAVFVYLIRTLAPAPLDGSQLSGLPFSILLWLGVHLLSGFVCVASGLHSEKANHFAVYSLSAVMVLLVVTVFRLFAIEFMGRSFLEIAYIPFEAGDFYQGLEDSTFVLSGIISGEILAYYVRRIMASRRLTR
jgi:hypothetical protein